MSTPNYTSLDALKYMAYRVTDTVSWTLDSLSGRGICSDEHDELAAIDAMRDEVKEVLGPLVEQWGRYSDGREVRTRVEIERGHIFDHLWHPDPAKDDESYVITGDRTADPGEDRGTYEITITPPQSVTVKLFPPKLRAVKP
ncbi:hypothetical protein [Nocardia farcinica]|uniref:hypothetical protein n=1 Tax=Nocardia farcinica TaxID=37329 RepID=UPI0024584348|nr:hypothetical protein [Nocardia farcinica]